MINVMFSDSELQKIHTTSLSYECACPAQVTDAIIMLRQLYDYQQNCVGRGGMSPQQAAVHQNIAQSAIAAHTKLEACLETILNMEGWDRATLEMPDGLRQLLSIPLGKPST